MIRGLLKEVRKLHIMQRWTGVIIPLTAVLFLPSKKSFSHTAIFEFLLLISDKRLKVQHSKDASYIAFYPVTHFPKVESICLPRPKKIQE